MTVSRQWRDIVPYALLAGAVFIAYANIYGGPFLADDLIWIVQNRFLRSWHNLPVLFTTSATAGSNYAGSYYRPLQILLYLTVFQIFGLAPYAFHLLGVVLHAANGCLVYRLGYRLGFKRGAALAAALIWALHPIQSEGVDYINALIDPLFAFFCLLGVLALLPDFAPRRFLLAVPLMLLGLLSKEAAIIFPLLAMSCFYLVSKKRFEIRTYLCFWPLVATSIIYAALRFALAVPHGSAVPVAMTHPGAYGPFAVFADLAGMILWPAHLHMEHDLPSYTDPWHLAVLAGLGLIALVLLQVQRTQTRNTLPMSWGLLWFGIAYLPTALVASRYFEHWLYLPTVGLFLGIAQTIALMLEKLPAQKKKKALRIAAIAIGLFAVLFVFMDYQQNKNWRSAEAFYRNTFGNGEPAPSLRIDYGLYYAERGEYQKALEQYQKASESEGAYLLNPTTASMLETDIAVAMLKLHPDLPEDALFHLQRAEKADPGNYAMLDASARFYEERGDTIKAAAYRSSANAARKNFRTYQEAEQQ